MLSYQKIMNKVFIWSLFSLFFDSVHPSLRSNIVIFDVDYVEDVVIVLALT